MQNIEKNLADKKKSQESCRVYKQTKKPNLYIQTTEWWLSEEKRGGGRTKKVKGVR